MDIQRGLKRPLKWWLFSWAIPRFSPILTSFHLQYYSPIILNWFRGILHFPPTGLPAVPAPDPQQVSEVKAQVKASSESEGQHLGETNMAIQKLIEKLPATQLS